ncbi:MAG: AI-2E family transporter [Bacteroidales bacterium]|nr:AI-2E family transporter [Bacteroidales bacterium]MBR6265309.1 AI-2E family transporter [Bacteroidales bacterium]MCR4799170.1 AI-2E family transporter [Bacteroidales bacterium]
MKGKFASLDTTNKLLMLLVLPMMFIILKELSNIFVPLIVACFFALLFMPFLRWSARMNIPRFVAIIVIFVTFVVVARCCVWILQLASQEIRGTDVQTWQQIYMNFKDFVVRLAVIVGLNEESILEHLQETDLVSTLYENAGNVLSAVRKTFSIVFLSIFFMILLLASSFNGQRILEVLLLKNKTSSMRTYITIEKSISKFIFVKIIISLLTGISFSILCYCFDVQFPIFWGVLAFILNFIQMIGSIISTAIMCVFAVTFLPTMSVTVLFIVLAIAIQLLFGSILEPIFMGKTFSINTVTIIVMLFFWGYVWNIPGMILAVPLTVTMKTIMEQFDRTRAIAALMS